MNLVINQEDCAAKVEVTGYFHIGCEVEKEISIKPGEWVILQMKGDPATIKEGLKEIEMLSKIPTAPLPIAILGSVSYMTVGILMGTLSAVVLIITLNFIKK